MTIGDRILTTAKQRGITQATLAEELGINQTSVSGWGKGSVPRIDKIPQIANVLGVSEEYLLAGVEVAKEEVVVIDTDTGEQTTVPEKDYKKTIFSLSAENEKLRAQLEERDQTIKHLNAHIALLTK